MLVGVLVRIMLNQFISNVTENVKILPCCLLGLEFFLLNLEDEVKSYFQLWIIYTIHFIQPKCHIYNLFIATYNPTCPPVLGNEPIHDILWATSTHSIVQCKIYDFMINSVVKKGQRANASINSPM